MGLPALAALLLTQFAAVLIAARPSIATPQRWIVAGFASGALVATYLAPGATALSLLAGAVVAVCLLGSPRMQRVLLMAGMVAGAGVAGALPLSEGWLCLPFWLLALLAVALSARLAGSRSGFAPLALRDQGGCALLIAAPVIAALPAAQSGWKSALALAGPSEVAQGPAAGWWWMALSVVALMSGALRQWWYRR
jgi:hypothetical protein